MKLLIRFALTVAGALTASGFLRTQAPAAAAAAPVSGPAIQFNTEDHDFGKILAGNNVKYTFVASNAGAGPLVISNASGACACMIVGEGSAANAWTPQIVAPGQTCRIPVEIATDDYRGQALSKFVEVTSNDKARPVVRLRIHGEVWLPVEVTPSAASFDLTGDTATNAVQILKIVNRMETPISLSDPQSDTNAFSAALKTNVPGQEFELTVTAAPPARRPPSFGTITVLGRITLKSSVPGMNRLTNLVYETISPEITVFPPEIQLPAGPLPQAAARDIAIRGNSSNLTLSSPGANVPGLDLSVGVIQTNRQYSLSAVFPKGFTIPPGRNIVLTVKTDNPRIPVLSIPVTFTPGSRKGY